jgi:flagellar hook-associated protein 1
MSLFGSLNLGTRGLFAAQTAIDVTGQNISNANTEGYSRKRVNLQPDSRMDSAYGEMGIGVEIASIDRVRNSFLDRQIYEQLGDKGLQQQINTTLTRLEDLFKEPTDGSLNDKLGSFYDAWQDLANNPQELSAREAVKAATKDMTDMFNSLALEMVDYRSKLDEQLQKEVGQINDLTSRIAKLNVEISTAEGQPGYNANDSRDQRDLLVKQLSELVDVTAIESDAGQVSVSTGGVLLVGPQSSAPIETYGISRTRSDGTQFTTLGLRLAESKKVFTPKGGIVRGIMDSKDAIVPGYEASLDSMAANLIAKVNEKHITGYNLNEQTGVLFFDPNYTDAKSIRLADAINLDSKNIAAARGGKASPIQSVDEFIPNAATPQVDLKATDPDYRNIVQGSVEIILDATGEALREGAGADYVVDYKLGVVTFLNYAKYAAADDITINMRYETNGFSGPGDGGQALDIAQLRQTATMSPDPLGNPTQSVNDFYSSFVGALGIQRNQVQSALDNKEFIIQQLDGEQLSLAGVSIDEEMVNMIKFQNSYQASARFISNVDRMMEVLMNI